ncbi:hypothetical protein M422DRAFT_269992 [Sphaerobolus stellatus SS14]|uniref:Uncharacterized protein n=1 Tax=Sphaerobolus stellatus (strain SS14) TaxID=990650 RepID=A0A0C9UTP9_SPHS4|nr:hypothetical protein M422DRAFT_269992 [Sphaerobolus stellatus SS14]
MEVDQMNIRLHELKLKLKDDNLVSADLLDAALNGCARIISKHNFIARTCSYNMRELILAHELERGHDAKPILLNADGDVEATDGAKSCRKRRRDESDMSDVESVRSKKVRVGSRVVRKSNSGEKDKGEVKKRMEK